MWMHNVCVLCACVVYVQPSCFDTQPGHGCRDVSEGHIGLDAGQDRQCDVDARCNGHGMGKDEPGLGQGTGGWTAWGMVHGRGWMTSDSQGVSVGVSMLVYVRVC